MVPIMLQRWHEISFLHWSCDGSDVAPHLPPGIIPDLYEGKAWIRLKAILSRYKHILLARDRHYLL
jgi:uncharacterized protein YqjF (DUF2071 family)